MDIFRYGSEVEVLVLVVLCECVVGELVVVVVRYVVSDLVVG